jgi:hypothetical protein
VTLYSQVVISRSLKKAKAIPLHASKALGGRGIASTHSRPLGVSGQRHASAAL